MWDKVGWGRCGAFVKGCGLGQESFSGNLSSSLVCQSFTAMCAVVIGCVYAGVRALAEERMVFDLLVYPYQLDWVEELVRAAPQVILARIRGHSLTDCQATP